MKHGVCDNRHEISAIGSGMDQPVGADFSGKSIRILTGELYILIKGVHLFSSFFSLSGELSGIDYQDWIFISNAMEKQDADKMAPRVIAFGNTILIQHST
jgi:hypothetical protein